MRKKYILFLLLIIFFTIAFQWSSISSYDEYGNEISNISIYNMNKAIEKKVIYTVKKIMKNTKINEYPLKIQKKDTYNYYNIPPIGQACSCGNIDIVKMLATNGANLNMKVLPTGETPLMLALNSPNLNDRLEIVRFLLSNNVNSNIARYNEQIFLAFNFPGFNDNEQKFEKKANEVLDIMDLLIKNNVDLSYELTHREVIISIAAIYDRVDIINYLLINKNSNFDINKKIELYENDLSTSKLYNDTTALIIAVRKNASIDTIKFLLSNGADKNIKDGDGYSALDYAISNNNYDVVKLLK